MLIDTHAHLWFPDYYPALQNQPGYYDELEVVMARAKSAGVEKMIVPGTDIESSKKAIELAKKYPGVIYASVGVHPEEVLSASSHKVRPSPPGRGWALPSRSDLLAAVAIGEIGTDASADELKSCMVQQKELFKLQCELALEYDLPAIIHTRNSLNEALGVLDGLPRMPRGQFHCFSHDENGLKLVLERGFYVSFCGNITWSKRVARLVSLVPNDRLLLETDSPLMVPRDKKGEPVQWEINERVAPSSTTRAQPSGVQNRNEPANVRILAEKIAEIRGQNVLDVEKFTTDNVNTLFKL